MKYCAYCHAELTGNAQFCGNCGMAVGIPADGHIRASNWPQIDDLDNIPPPRFHSHKLSPLPFAPAEFPTSPPPSFEADPLWGRSLQDIAQGGGNTPATPDDEEEERRRRAALVGMGLLGAIPQGNSVPMVSGAPQLSAVPAVQGAPQLAGGAPQYLGGTAQVLPQSPPGYFPGSVSPTPHLPPGSSLTLPQQHPQPPSGSHGPQGGCAPALVITLIIIPVLIIASIIGLGLTIFAPGLSLSSSSASVGSTLILHGSHFVPGSSISLERDGGRPIYVLHHTNGGATAQSSIPATRQLSRQLAQVSISLAGSSTIKAGGDGSFSITITIDSSWTAGQHTIAATEAITHRSASLAVTILPPFTMPTTTPTTTTTKTPAPTKTGTPGVTPTSGVTPPSTHGSLSCLNPSSLMFGPVAQSYSVNQTSNVTLCASGSGLVYWSASWNTSQDSWLSLNSSSGQITAPGQAQIVVSANASQLTAGTYSATITFSSSSSSATQTLVVTFAVQAGCLKGSPSSLAFRGVQNISDPAPQKVGLTNCGTAGSWMASASTLDGAQWLSANPVSGNLTGGGPGQVPENVTIAASNLSAKLGPGNYRGSVTFTLGASSFVVQVMLNVLPAPTLSTNTTALTSMNCGVSGSYYLCNMTLINESRISSLTWTYSGHLIPGLVVKAPGFTIPAGLSERIQVYIPVNDCSGGSYITFTGPVNSVNVSWQCIIIG